MTDLLNDYDDPVNFRHEPYASIFRRLQGNILKGHGRDYTVNLFLEFQVGSDALRRTLRWIARNYVTAAYQQMLDRERYDQFGIPGAVFGNLFLTVSAYRKLQLENVPAWFSDPLDEGKPATAPPEDGTQPTAPFVEGMLNGATDLGDLLPPEPRDPLEVAYAEKRIDALLLLADDGKDYLLRRARSVVEYLERRGLAKVVAVEHGEVLRNEHGQGIEHFGYVDGRSQPLFLASDFRKLEQDRAFGSATRERVNDGTEGDASGPIDLWNPFAKMSLALLKDPGTDHPHAFGSYYVFRKLEQDVRGFAKAEQDLAAALNPSAPDRTRAGAMIVGRFKDGTPLTLSNSPDLIPAVANNFRYDGLDAQFQPHSSSPTDPLGLRCPFQAHIRKVNPRQNAGVSDGSNSDAERARIDAGRRIVRRGITYGARLLPPGKERTLEELPSGGVGLLFACFQASIRNQFLFMQRMWANNPHFRVSAAGANNTTGLDGVIGGAVPGAFLPQHWRDEYGGDVGHTGAVNSLTISESHPTQFDVHGFVRFRGGEYFFAPSLTFLLGD
jgi:Dyp-type peroxidase family